MAASASTERAGRARGGAVALGLALGLLAGCAPAVPPSERLVRVCDQAGCRDQPASVQTFQPSEEDRALQRPQDPDTYRGESAAALREAAAAGDARAAHRLGQAYETGAGGVPRSAAQAARQYEIAAAAGMPWAAWRLARLVEQGAAPGGRARALQLTTEAARGGVAPAAYQLGVLYREGRGVPRDAAEAARWFTVAAENGVPEAQYNLALMLFRGDGVPRQPYQALQWMRRAGQNGVLLAQKAVGRLYMTGLEEMGQDLAEAQSWLSLAAGRGDAEARRWLAQVEPALAAERQANRAFQQQLALQAAQTQALWAAIAWATLFAPPVYGGPYGGFYW